MQGNIGDAREGYFDTTISFLRQMKEEESETFPGTENVFPLSFHITRTRCVRCRIFAPPTDPTMRWSLLQHKGFSFWGPSVEWWYSTL